MKPDRWRRVEELYHGALAREGSERLRFLDEEAAGDDELRREVESLLAFEDETETFLESTALSEVARSFAGPAAKPEYQPRILSRLFSLEDDDTNVVHELRVTTPQGHTRSLLLERRRLTLGRAEANDLPFPEDDGLSRRHMIFEYEDEQWSVIDLGSKNGTYVNGTRIGEKRRLQPGDQITASCITIYYS